MTTSSPTKSVRSPLASARPTPLAHRVVERFLGFASLMVMTSFILIFAFVAREALPLLWTHDDVVLRELFEPRQWPGYDVPAYVWQPIGKIAKLNVLPLLVGTFKVTLMTMLFSVPLAIGSAIFVSQYAPTNARRILKPTIEMLAGIPSVVIGIVALVLLATSLQKIFGFTYRLNAFVAAFALSLSVIPIVFTIAEDALSAVPETLKDAALSLGAHRHQIILRVVIPAALPGIAAAIILGFGRAIGETMVVLMVSGNAPVMRIFDPSSSARTITATIAAELGEAARGDAHWRVIFFLGVVLFITTFVFNRLGAIMVARLHRRLSVAS